MRALGHSRRRRHRRGSRCRPLPARRRSWSRAPPRRRAAEGARGPRCLRTGSLHRIPPPRRRRPRGWRRWCSLLLWPARGPLCGRCAARCSAEQARRYGSRARGAPPGGRSRATLPARRPHPRSPASGAAIRRPCVARGRAAPPASSAARRFAPPIRRRGPAARVRNRRRGAPPARARRRAARAAHPPPGRRSRRSAPRRSRRRDRRARAPARPRGT